MVTMQVTMTKGTKRFRLSVPCFRRTVTGLERCRQIRAEDRIAIQHVQIISMANSAIAANRTTAQNISIALADPPLYVLA
jgi:CheY-like chemotaxis protein